MKIRALLHFTEKSSAVLLTPIQQETADHLLLKLAASILFHNQEPIVAPSSQHPALREQDFLPDLFHVNDRNEVTLWIECDKTTVHKMEKVAKRYRDARLVMLMMQPLEAKQMAANVPDEKWNRWEIYAFALGAFDRWRQIIRESNDVMGEADERSMNLVVNEDVYVTDLEKIR